MKTLSCREATELIDAYIDGAVEKELQASMEAHLAECPACAKLARVRKALSDAVGDTAETLPPALHETLIAMAKRETARRRTARRLVPRIGAVAAAFLVVTVGVVAVVNGTFKNSASQEADFGEYAIEKKGTEKGTSRVQAEEKGTVAADNSYGKAVEKGTVAASDAYFDHLSDSEVESVVIQNKTVTGRLTDRVSGDTVTLGYSETPLSGETETYAFALGEIAVSDSRFYIAWNDTPAFRIKMGSLSVSKDGITLTLYAEEGEELNGYTSEWTTYFEYVGGTLPGGLVP